ncbi:nSTAND3 domain-containing NTPase [Kitasatospora cineracea]
MARNYSELSPHDFEVLVRDLLQIEFGVRLETFPQGRDGGVDIRLHRNGEESIIIQCKHSPGRNFGQIKSQLEREADKVAGKFSCRYILATSASLTRSNKADIVDIFNGVNLDQSDILGMDDLENLLSSHPEVEIRNFKLWITSSAVLDRLLNSDLYSRNSAFIDKVARRRRIYVHSEAFSAAERILESSHVCVISGVPGIGKTTLAETLLVRLMSDGWEVCLASEDISDVERLWKPDKKQAFLYDDFLGQNILTGSLNKNEDSRLASLIERIGHDCSKRLVMTTREYILAQAIQTYEPLERAPGLRRGKMVLNLAHYTDIQKAQILYNHLYFANLQRAAIRSTLENRSYRKIISHPNYNPRIIEFVTLNFGDSGSRSADFHDYFLSALDNPWELWDRIYENQLSRAERDALLILSTFGEKAEHDDLLTAIRTYEESSYGVPSTDARVLRKALRKLQGTFIETSVGIDIGCDRSPDNPSGPNLAFISFSNPSFVDYISAYLASHPDELTRLISGAAFFDQTLTISLWISGGSYLQTRKLPAIRLRTGDEVLIIRSMKKLIDSGSCRWASPGKGHRRLRVDTHRRWLVTLKAAAHMGHLAETLPLALEICKELSSPASSNFYEFAYDGELFVQLMQILVRYEEAAPLLPKIRTRAAEWMIENASEPADFCEALMLYTDVHLTFENPEVSAFGEESIRSSFEYFAADWDLGKAGEYSNSLDECIEAKSELDAAISHFDFPPGVQATHLEDRISLLQDEMEPDEDMYQEFDEEQRYFDASSGGSSKSQISAVSIIDPIDDLFETLADY